MIKEYFQSYGVLSEDEIKAFLDLTIPTTMKKGEYLVKEGHVSKNIAFIQSGIFRSYYHSTESEAVTYCFTFENTLLTAYTSWIRQEPSAENIEALTDMELLLISKEDVELLFSKYPNWVRFFKDIAEQEYINLEKRIFMLQRESAETRYSHLMKNYPEYLDKIPLQYLASYLGVTQRHLSRIRSNITF